MVPSQPERPTRPRPDLPLAGLRVLSLAEQYPGPFATMLLADLGADVILIERPTGGDPTRRFTGHFEALNRNKRSIALDLKSEDGREVFWRLAPTADAVVEGYKPGTVDRLGIGPRQARTRLPALVYASISSFGQTGPLGARGGHDISMQGMTGLVQGDDPRPAPLPLADLASAMFAAFGVVAALLGRERNGTAGYLDVSMLDSLVSWRSTVLVSELNGLDPAPYPPLDPGYGVVENSRGERLTLSIAGEDHQWRGLCAALGLDHLATLSTVERERDRRAIADELRSAFRKADWALLEPQLAAHGVGFGPVYDDREITTDEQVVARRMIVDVPGAGDPPGAGPDERGGRVRVVRQPVLFDGAGGVIASRAPRLGQHTRPVLRDLGYSDLDVDALVARGVVVTHEGGRS
ncbi:CaiB/BaiF CoA-transferase family protein [Frankia sp. AvcI1]|uniref:CaiB/BaiF CoA transferase family protein n=1 Tax=Frankia sp. AvcI1 TaxID=573496 RepID=UPI0021179892|nr:CaiB/BaiF CoA-transferase family protein [Frankia sp. AvcI1]